MRKTTGRSSYSETSPNFNVLLGERALALKILERRDMVVFRLVLYCCFLAEIRDFY